MGLHTWLFKNMTFHPRQTDAHGGYPLDLDGSLAFTRPKTGYDFWPAHDNADNYQQLGAVSGLMPQQDRLVWAQGYGKDPFGPIMGSITPPINLTYQATIPGLTKQDSQ